VSSYVPQGTTLYRAVGCDHCSNTGYRGRLPITADVVVNKEIERRVSANESAARIADAARESGARSLWDSGLSHVCRGDSTMDELLRVVEVPLKEGERDSGSDSKGSSSTSSNGTQTSVQSSARTSARRTPLSNRVITHR